MVEGKKNNDLQAYQQKLKIAQREPYSKPGVNSGAPEGWAVPAPCVAHTVL